MNREPVNPRHDDLRQPVVQMTAISKRYPGVRALDAVSLVLFPGEIHALAGENGSGKSTLAKILYGSVRADTGRIEMDGVEVSWTSPRQALEKGIVGISQELTLAPTLSVAENVLMGRLPLTRLRSIDWRAARRATRAVLDELDVHVDPRTRVGDLSVELQQEVEIARAISTEFRVLVLDEATSSLSEAATTRLLTKLEEVRRRGSAILFISHRLRELYECADKATVLRDGRLVGEFPLPLVPESELVRSMVGRPISDLYHKRKVPKGDVFLSVSRLSAPGRNAHRCDLRCPSGGDRRHRRARRLGQGGDRARARRGDIGNGRCDRRGQTGEARHAMARPGRRSRVCARRPEARGIAPYPDGAAQHVHRLARSPRTRGRPQLTD